MKRIFLSPLLLLFAFHLNAQTTRPLPENINAALDSILAEGYTLYLQEKLAWIATDACVEYVEDLSGVRMTVFPSGEDEITSLFFRDKDSTSVFQLKMDLADGSISGETDPRPLNELEKGAVRLKEKLLEKIEEARIGIASHPDAEGDLNFQFIPMNGMIRVYFLQGTTKSNMIPFGNDATVDFDEDLNLIGWRREHKSFIPAETVSDAGPIVSVIHSHTSDNPFISPTDICTFLLYGHDLYGMNTFSVLSTAFGMVFTFDAGEFSIKVRSFAEYAGESGQ